MFETIRGKRVLITGATGGIGEAFAEIFAHHGARLGLQYYANREKAVAMQKNLQSRGIESELFQADVSDEISRAKLAPAFIEKFGGIDVLINNAGGAYTHEHFSTLAPEIFQRTFALNVEAPFYLSGAAFEDMKKHGGGRIINISSVNVKYGGSSRSMHYCAAKAALESLTVGFARDGAQYNILVNAIRCGYIDTPMRTKIPGYSEKDFQRRIDLIPLKRMGKPEDIARMALFLASEAGDFITKEIISIAGGD